MTTITGTKWFGGHPSKFAIVLWNHKVAQLHKRYKRYDCIVNCKTFYRASTLRVLQHKTKYSRMDQVKFVEDNFQKIRRDMVCFISFQIF